MKSKNLSEEIYTLCEDRFNLNSPKQVGDILFEKLKLPSGKKVKQDILPMKSFKCTFR